MNAAERAAHQYADAGWPVFPCRPGHKLPLLPSAHPASGLPEGGSRCAGECGREGHGFRDAVTDHAAISRWWRRAPDANIGVATGAPGPDVIDVDVKPGVSGYAAWNTAKAAGLLTGARAIVRTPSGGMHAYYAGTAQRSATIAGRALDFRAAGGYVVAPPSWSGEHGRGYEVLAHQASDAAVDWQAIRRLVDPEPEHHRRPRPAPAPAAGRDGVAHLAGWLASQPEGSRNDRLFWASCRAVEAGDEDTLTALARAAESAGLASREVAATIASARRTARAVEPRPFEREAG